MNGKMKVLIALVFVIGISAVALYAVPIMAYQNGTLNQDHMRNCAPNCKRDCECLYLQNENCTFQSDCQQHRYCQQFQHEECTENMGAMQMGMMGATNNNRCRNWEGCGMGH